MKMCNCKHALGYEEETGCAVCGHDGCEYNDTIEQLQARVKELESWRDTAYEHSDRIDTLEQQLKDAKAKITILEKFANSTTPIDPPLAVQIQQAEKRGYELAISALYNMAHTDDCDCFKRMDTYEQAIAERDGGEKKE